MKKSFLSVGLTALALVLASCGDGGMSIVDVKAIVAANAENSDVSYDMCVFKETVIKNSVTGSPILVQEYNANNKIPSVGSVINTYYYAGTADYNNLIITEAAVDQVADLPNNTGDGVTASYRFEQVETGLQLTQTIETSYSDSESSFSLVVTVVIVYGDDNYMISQRATTIQELTLKVNYQTYTLKVEYESYGLTTFS